jgi:hypothetical protein
VALPGVKRFIMVNEKVKSNSVVTASWEGSVLTLTVKGVGDIIFAMDDVGPVLVERASMHGFEQRLRDRAAIGRDDKTGLSASPQDKYDRIKALADHYAAGGEWEMRSVGGGGKKSEADWIMEALASVQGVSVADIGVKVAIACEKRGITEKAYLMKIATNPAVSQRLAELKYGNAEGGDEMLEDL